MIFNRRAAEREPVLRFQKARCLGRLGPRVFDRLGLVEDHKVKLSFLKVQRIAAQSTISGDNEVVVLEMFAALRPVTSGVSQQTQCRSESRRFLLPIKDERARHNYQRWQSL